MTVLDRVLTFMGDHPYLTFFLALIVFSSIESIFEAAFH